METKDRIISSQKSVIVAADVSTLDELRRLAIAVRGVQGIGGFKLGFRVALKGIATAVQIIRANYGQDCPIIYDHQKAGNDIPDMGKGFAQDLRNAEVTAAILFPFAGPSTQESWTKACFDVGLKVLTGGIMTHPRFLVSEGGYIADEAVEKIFGRACQSGVRHFVVPGNKLDWVKKIRGWLTKELGEDNYAIYAPGFIDQGGNIGECALISGDEWHAIVGGAIYKQKNIREAAVTVTQQII